MIDRALVAFALIVCSCAGVRAGVFGGYSNTDGVLHGTTEPVEIDAGGGFFGVFVSGQVTPNLPPQPPNYGLGYDTSKRPNVEAPDDSPSAFNPTRNPYALGGYIALMAAATAALRKYTGVQSA